MNAHLEAARLWTALLAALACGLSAAPARAQAPPVSPDDFVAAAGGSNGYEMAAAHVVLTGSRNADVRAFAKQMLAEHTAMNAGLGAAAARAGLKPPSDAVGADAVLLLAALQSQRGAELDRTYARQQVIAHSSALATEGGYARHGSSTELRALATSDLPMIQQHLQAATRLKSATGG